MAGLESPVEESPWGVVEEEATIDSRRERRLRARGARGCGVRCCRPGASRVGLGRRFGRRAKRAVPFCELREQEVNGS